MRYQIINHQNPDFTNYRVKRSDTLFGIAQKFGVGLQELMRFNNLNPRSPIYPGQIIRIPNFSPPSLLPVNPPRPPAPPVVSHPPMHRPPASPQPPHQHPGGQTPINSRVHVVNRGETLTGIARRYGVSVGELMRANRLRNDLILVGQRLVIPGTPFVVDTPIGRIDVGGIINAVR